MLAAKAGLRAEHDERFFLKKCRDFVCVFCECSSFPRSRIQKTRVGQTNLQMDDWSTARTADSYTDHRSTTYEAEGTSGTTGTYYTTETTSTDSTSNTTWYTELTSEFSTTKNPTTVEPGYGCDSCSTIPDSTSTLASMHTDSTSTGTYNFFTATTAQQRPLLPIIEDSSTNTDLASTKVDYSFTATTRLQTDSTNTVSDNFFTAITQPRDDFHSTRNLETDATQTVFESVSVSDPIRSAGTTVSTTQNFEDTTLCAENTGEPTLPRD